MVRYNDTNNFFQPMSSYIVTNFIKPFTLMRNDDTPPGLMYIRKITNFIQLRKLVDIN